MPPTAPKLGVRKTYNTGYYRSSGQGFRAGSESGVVYHVPGVSGTVCRGIQGSWMQGGRGPIGSEECFLSADRRRAGDGIRRCCLNASGGEVEALLRRGSRWGDQGWLSRQADAFEVAAYRGRLGERCDDAHAPSGNWC